MAKSIAFNYAKTKIKTTSGKRKLRPGH